MCIYIYIYIYMYICKIDETVKQISMHSSNQSLMDSSLLNSHTFQYIYFDPSSANG